MNATSVAIDAKKPTTTIMNNTKAMNVTTSPERTSQTFVNGFEMQENSTLVDGVVTSMNGKSTKYGNNTAPLDSKEPRTSNDTFHNVGNEVEANPNFSLLNDVADVGTAQSNEGELIFLHLIIKYQIDIALWMNRTDHML